MDAPSEVYERDRAATFIESLSHAKKIDFVACLMYELTVSGRCCYSHDSAGLDNPVLLRKVNEIQHLLSAQLMSLLAENGHLRPWSLIAGMFLRSGPEGRAVPEEIRVALIITLAAFTNR